MNKVMIIIGMKNTRWKADVRDVNGVIISKHIWNATDLQWEDDNA